MKEYTDSILDRLAKYPRANLLQTPALIHKLPRLSSNTGCNIYILRDDLTGFALGGNKTRKLDYLVGDAVAKKADTRVLGVSASLRAEAQSERVRELASSTARMLGTQLDETKILVDDRFVGPGYAVPSEEGENAVNMFAALEGILLDQVYAGKAAAALLHYATNRVFESDIVLFIHTGGNAGLFY